MKYKTDKRLSRAISAVLALIVVVVIAYFAIDYVSKNSVQQTAADASGDSFVRIIDIGQGDSILISSKGQNCLIDTGDFGTADELSKKLRSYGVKKLDVLTVTHFHDDHTGGIEKVTENFEIGNLIYPDISKSESYSQNERIARQNVLAEEGEFFTAKQGMHFNIGDFEVTVIGYYSDFKNENSKSLVFMASIYGKKFLITGDAETDTESALVDEGIDLSCDVLKVGHHGSNTSSSKKFLEAAHPKFAAISCGAGNKYSHPHEVVVARLEKADIEVFRTDISGDITFNVSPGGIIDIKTEK